MLDSAGRQMTKQGQILPRSYRRLKIRSQTPYFLVLVLVFFVSPPKGLTSSLFIICVQLAYLKLSSVEKIYLHLSLIISTYCLIFTRFTELLRGIINNKRRENLLAEAEHACCECLLTHSDAQTETGWVLHHGVLSSEQGA